MARGDAQRMNAQRPRLVGRDEELARLADIADRSVEFGAQMVLLSGDAGIGKSTLTAAFLDEQTEGGWACHVGHCIEYADRPLPFGPVVSVLRSILLDNLEHVDEIVGSHREDLSGLLPELVDEAERPALQVGDVDRLFDAIAAVLVRAARVRPMAVLVEDVHWADAATRDLLASLVHALGPARVMLLVTERSGALSRSHPLRTWLSEQRRFPNVHSIELEGLSLTELGAQAADLLGEEPDARLVEELFDRTEGNPYFAHEFLVAHRSGAGDELPSSLRDFLTSRLERLSADEREVVRAVAIGGGVVGHRLLSTMLPELPMGEIVRSLFDQSVLKVEDQDYTFGHGLIREAILAEILPFEAEELHRRTAEALEVLLPQSRALSDSVALAIHWDGAGDAEKTIETSITAADAAAASAAYDTASDLALAALAAWDRAPLAAEVASIDRDELAARCAAWLTSCLRAQEASDLLAEALETWAAGLAPHKRARLLAVRGTIEFDLTDRAVAEALLDQAAALVGDSVTPEASRVHHALSNHGLRMGLIHRAIDSAERTIEIAQQVGPEVEMIEAMCTRALGVGVTKDRDAGLELLTEARERALASGNSEQVARTYRIETSIICFRDGRTEPSLLASEKGLAFAERHLGPRARAHIRLDLALGLVEAGRLAEAAPHLEILLASELDEWRMLTVHQTAALAAMGAGDLHEAGGHLERAADIALRYQSAGETGYQSRLAAELHRRQGQLDLATKEIRTALELQLKSDNLTYTRESIVEHARIVNALLAAGAATAVEMRAEAEDLAASFDGPGSANLAWRALMDVEIAAFDSAVTERQLLDTVARLEAAGFLYESAQARLLFLDQCLRAGALDAIDASRHLTDLLQLSQPNAMDWIVERARSYSKIGRVPITVPEREPKQSTEPQLPHGLTPREVEVMALLAEGLTNKAIGERLYVSPRTVSTHISNLLGKLGVSNRGEAAAAYHRLGLQEVVDLRDRALVD